MIGPTCPKVNRINPRINPIAYGNPDIYRRLTDNHNRGRRLAIPFNPSVRSPLAAAALAIRPHLGLRGCQPARRKFGGPSLPAPCGDLETARSSIRQAIATRDDVADYYVLLGRIELQAERPTSAFNAYSPGLDLQADNPEVLQAIAELGLQTGRLHEADEAADRMLLLMPNAVQAMLVKGFIAIDDGRIPDAWKMANDILALNPNDEGGIILLARLRALEGQQDQAFRSLMLRAARGSGYSRHESHQTGNLSPARRCGPG